jgi:flagellum-specific peptidoglycan hydrolase FlgJ
MQPQHYIKRFISFITARVKGTGLLPSIVMAHALYEAADDDGYIGKSVHAASYNNDVRIRADASWTGPKVLLPLRQSSSASKRRRAWYRVYSSPEQAIEDRIEMLKQRVSVWPTTLLHSDTLKVQASIFELSTMSTDPLYADRIVHLVHKHKLYRCDRQWLIEKVVKIALFIASVELLVHVLGSWDLFVPWR